MRHLVRRFVGSLSRREPEPGDTEWAESLLLDGEVKLWRRLSAPDRRHAIAVARRFAKLGSAEWARDEMAGALLHDVGKLADDLGTFRRVVATIVGPATARFRRYHDHEQIGAVMLAEADSSTVTVELVMGKGPAAAALAEADNI